MFSRRKSNFKGKEIRIAQFTVIGLCVLLAPILYVSYFRNTKIDSLRQTGVVTTAVVLKTEKTTHNAIYGSFPECYISFKYRTKSGKTYVGGDNVSAWQGSKLHRGDTFTVWYAPTDPVLVLTPWPDARKSAAIRSLLVALLLITLTAAALLIPFYYSRAGASRQRLQLLARQGGQSHH
jgi:hypothetical protein